MESRRAWVIATQITLNTFHFAGVSSNNVTLGNHKYFQESKTSFLTVFLTGDAEPTSVSFGAHHLVEGNSQHCYLPYMQRIVISEDQEFANVYYEMPDFNRIRISPCLLRIEWKYSKCKT
ncbi:DNA-directed RNA polymerase II subunit RPB1-like [Bactrocera oleae]|uniref:DNA-directed RNA polymerase II subunit RPB1-like n=1 Tax=Bactrocera oleae TaxID=104688 RepID=UPI00387E9979